MSDRKQKLLGSKTKFLEAITVDVDGVHERFDIRADSVAAKSAMAEAAVAAGEIGKDGQPTSNENAMRFTARVVVASTFEPGTTQPSFTAEDIPELINTHFFEELSQKVLKAIGPVGAKGKSPAAASEQPASPSPSPSTDSPTK